MIVPTQIIFIKLTPTYHRVIVIIVQLNLVIFPNRYQPQQRTQTLKPNKITLAFVCFLTHNQGYFNLAGRDDLFFSASQHLNSGMCLMFSCLYLCIIKILQYGQRS